MADNATNTAVETTTTTQAQADNKPATQPQTTPASNVLSDEEIAKKVQAETDKRTADYGKKLAAMQKELDEMRKEKMTADERKKFEDEQREKERAEKDRLLTERENRLTAIEELTKAKLYDGGDKSNAFVNLVIKGASAEEIADNVKAVKAYVDEQIAKGVDETFKANGRVPNGSGRESGADKDTKNNYAVELGKKTAETAKKTNEILNHYINGGRS